MNEASHSAVEEQLEERISQNDARMGQLLTTLTARPGRSPRSHHPRPNRFSSPSSPRRRRACAPCRRPRPPLSPSVSG